ncbi:hypothetical protein AQUCO_02100166v1 [Aquilegia coerulea]|uniref:Plant bHLH transcription factor ACT-like domain-containing protein n=1 Tax=Aquilegia coerulea TaxID=218851 RepID=A0A2G5DF26_AQUCA|nr:hypothetical protein AQUCO_02100166v1 [Aquilegia coerulea]
MVSKVERQKVLNQKLQVLKAITRSKSEEKGDILMDALSYINLLKQKIEDMNKEYEELINQALVVKVKKLENNCFEVVVTCKKVQDLLMSIMESLEEIGLDVLHVDINCSQLFHLEVIAEAEDSSTLDVEKVTETIYEVLETKGVKKNTGPN